MLNLGQESISWCLTGNHNQIQGNKYIYWFNIQSYMINTSMFYNKPINLTTIVMDSCLFLGIRTDLESHFSKKFRKEITRIVSCINWSQHI